jgi:hypothetical protein
MILDTNSGRIQANWSVEQNGHFRIVAPFNDGLLGKAEIGVFPYRPHAELAARAPAMAEAMEEFCARVERGEIRSTRTYEKFCRLINREPRT